MQKRKKLYVRPFRKLKHPVTGAPFLYIYWKKDGWFLVKQLADHVLGVPYSALKFRIWTALQDLPGNTRRKWKHLCRCIPIEHKQVLKQIKMTGVSAVTDLDNQMYLVDLQTTRYILKSYETKTNGRMFSLFEAILELCYGPPDDIFKISVNDNPLRPLNNHTSVIDFDKEYFQCECGRHYALSDDNGHVEHMEGLTDSLIGHSMKRKKRRRTGVTGKEKMWLLANQKYKCNVCNSPIGTTAGSSDGNVIPFDVDHKIEVSRGGCNSVKINMQALCLNCHRWKTLEHGERPFDAIGKQF